MSTVIKVEDLSKQYRLGLVGASTFKEDTQRWWAKMRGKVDPFLTLGSENDRTFKDDSKFVWSLKDINFDVEQGDVLGVLGRNGAGKSTLLKILSKVTAPTIGSVKIKGRVASLLEVGTGFHPELTGRENIYLNGAILGMRKFEISSKLDEIIFFAGVEKYIDTPVKRYSSGMYVRLAFAVAAHLESDILIVDEVLAVGDAEFQQKCLGKMNEVSRGEGRTVIFVSHNITSILNLCNKGLLLSNGKLVANENIDSISKLYSKSLYDNVVSNKIEFNSKRIIFAASFFDYQNQLTNQFFCGSIMKIKATLVRKVYLGKIDITFAINNILGQRLVTFDTRYQYKNQINNKDEISFLLTWNKIILTPGEYLMSVGIYENNNYIDGEDNVLNLTIVESDYYNTGKLPDNGQGNILTDVEWKIS